MNLERFAVLAEAYGGDVGRWPLAEREAATLLMAARPEATAPILSAQGDLDWALDAWRAPAASSALQAAILAAAPVARRAPAWRSWVWRTGLGAGLMAAGAAGVMAGVVASSAIAPASAEFDVITAAVSASETLDAQVVDDV